MNAKLITALVALISLGGIFAAAQMPMDVNPIVLKVNGEPVYAAEVSMMMQTLAAQAAQTGQQPTKEQLADLATKRTIDQKLLAQEARRFGISPDEERVSQMANQMVQQAGGREQLDKFLDEAGSSYEQAVKIIREMDLAMRLIDSQIAPTVKVTDDEVKAYYEQNPDRFQSEEQVKARHIIFSAKQGDDEATVAAVRKKAEAARERAMAGEDFATLAKELSEGPSASRGGDLGFFNRQQMVKPFADAAFALEVGTISEVIRSSFGFHVILVEEHRPAGKLGFDEVKGRLADGLRRQKVGEAVNGLIETLNNKATIEEVAPDGAIQLNP